MMAEISEAWLAPADLYVVWTRGWLHPPDAERSLEAEPLDAEAVVKLRWTMRR